jgi:fructokinase
MKLQMPDIISFGEALIDLFAGRGVALRELKPLHPSPGGAPANVAVALARLGVKAGFVGKVGDDGYGRLLVDLLHSEGVDTSHLVVDPGGPTMLAIVDAPSPTEQHFVLYHGADALLQPEELDQAYIQSARVFIYGSVTLTQASGPAALRATRWARDAGESVIFDVNLRPTLWPDLETARRSIGDAVELATVVKLNETELEFLTGTSDPAVGSQKLLACGVHLCCVSLGGNGSYFHSGAASGHVSAFSVQVVDTTGSGDAFVAGLACQLSEFGQPVEQLSDAELRHALRFANACGALAATRLGAMRPLPTRQVVEQLLQRG